MMNLKDIKTNTTKPLKQEESNKQTEQHHSQHFKTAHVKPTFNIKAFKQDLTNVHQRHDDNTRVSVQTTHKQSVIPFW